MVMEAPPSPQSVGREFVRQYYTLLNKAPTHLHRFYNHQSAFIHGGLDPNRETVPFVGQKQIHQKIQQLNFRDCHAKITQVDSQSTLGGGVVVQVTGELSNAGQPMRRFTQTFVLASQSPKKYYVHNDIFRYQDEIITDEDCDGDIRCEVNEECLERSSSITEPQTQSLGQPILPAAPGLPFYSGSTVVPPPPTAAAGGNLPSINSQQPSVTAPHQPPHNILPPSQQQQQQQPQINNPPPQSAATATLNGHPEDLSMLQSHLPQTVQQQQQPLSAPIPSLPTQVIQNQPTVVPTTVDVLQEENEIRNEEPIIEGGYGDVAETEQEQEIPQEPASNEPKTYANLLKNTSGGGQSQVTYQSPPQAITASTVPSSATSSYRTHSPPNNSHRGPQMNGIGNSNNRTGNNGPRLSSQGPPQTTRGGPSNNSHNRGGPRTGGDDNIDDEQRRRRSQSSNFGQLDANQLFLGNLPHSATEDELKEIFSEFGTVLDLRVHSKPPGMGLKPNQGGRAPPNYGFITYDTQASVMACLAAKPIFYPKNDSTGTQMNVEEKKNKDSGGRPSYGGNGGRQGLDNNRSGGRGDGPRRGGGGGGMGGLGGPRGGPGGPQGQGDRNRTGGDRDNNNRYNRSGGGGSSFRGGQNNYNRR